MEFNVCPQGHKLPNWYGSYLVCACQGTAGTEITLESLAAARRWLDKMEKGEKA